METKVSKEALLNDSEGYLKIKQNKLKERIMLEWSNINYTIDIDDKKNKKQVAQMESAVVTERWSDRTSQYVDSNRNTENGSLTTEEEIMDPFKKVILKNVEGFALPNELLAIIGPSGCGKTSLLNIIACRQISSDKKHHVTRDVRKIKIRLKI